MNIPQPDYPQLPPLPASEMDRDGIDTLSYIFCSNIHFDSFDALRLYYMAREPGKRGIREFWQEVGELGYCQGKVLNNKLINDKPSVKSN